MILYKRLQPHLWSLDICSSPSEASGQKDCDISDTASQKNSEDKNSTGGRHRFRACSVAYKLYDLGQVA